MKNVLLLLGVIALVSPTMCFANDPTSKDLPSKREMEFTSVSAKVVAVDKANRVVSLKTEGSEKAVELKMGPEVRNFDQIAVGDTVTANYAESVAIKVVPGKEGASIETGTVVARAKPGAKPAGFIGTETEVRAVVTALDLSTRELTLRGPKGNETTWTIGEEVKKLSNVKPGDEVVLTVAESVAVSVTKTN